MNFYIDKNKEQLDKMAANEIKNAIINKPESVLGLATGSTPLGVYKQLIDLYKTGHLDFSETVTYNLDEYVGLLKNHPSSYYYYMRENLFDHINIKKDNFYLPDGEADNLKDECSNYDKKILSSGGIDIQILGIGHNGHIGFNEPGTPYDSNTHIVDLDERTIKANSRFFSSIDGVPKQAISMGIKTIMKARKIILIATGEDKAEIIKRALHGTITPLVPASVLQLHPDFTVFLDTKAASRLPKMASRKYVDMGGHYNYEVNNIHYSKTNSCTGPGF